MSNINDALVYGSGFAWKHNLKKFPYKMYREIDLKNIIMKFLKEKYNPDKTTIELSDLWDFFNIEEGDILKDVFQEKSA